MAKFSDSDEITWRQTLQCFMKKVHQDSNKKFERDLFEIKNERNVFSNRQAAKTN